MNAQEAFEDMFNRIMECGLYKSGTKYIRNVSLQIMEPLDNTIETPWRKWSHSYALLEWEWYLSGDRSPQMVEERAKLWSKMKDDQGKVWSNYGWWWKQGYPQDQVGQVLNELYNNQESRRAIITHYAPPRHHDQYKQDTPCNLILNFYIENDKLCLTTFARSIDLIFGFCNDQFCFSKLMELIAGKLNIQVGTFTYMITDLHIYEKDWNRKSKYLTNKQNGKS